MSNNFATLLSNVYNLQLIAHACNKQKDARLVRVAAFFRQEIHSSLSNAVIALHS